MNENQCKVNKFKVHGLNYKYPKNDLNQESMIKDYKESIE